MQVNYELTTHDYIEFNKYHATHSVSMHRTLFVHRYIASLVFLIMPFILGRLGNEIPLLYWLLTFIGVYILWVVYYKRYFMWDLTKRISRMIDEGRNANILGNHSLCLDDDGIVETSSHSQSRTNYKAIERIEETNEYIFIYNSSISAFIIPVKFFESIEQKSIFIDKLKNMVKKNRCM